MPEPRPNFIAEYIMVQCYGKRSTFVMVEGEADEEVWGRFGATKCRFFPSRGKDNIIEALTISELRELPGTAGIIDLDYSLIADSYPRNISNLLYDDCCPDMESILLCSPALKKVLRHTLDDEEIDKIHDFADELVQESLRLAMEFGYFRWLNHCQDYGLPCNQIRFDEAIDPVALKLDCQWVAKRLAEASDTITSEQLLNEAAELRAKRLPDTIQLCRGKDVLAIMAFILPYLYEKRFAHDLPASAMSLRKDGQLAKELRKAYEYMYFRETALFASIEEWEGANSPYKILKQAI